MVLKGGMEGILAFLEQLRQRNIKFTIGQQSPESLDVSFAIVRHRIEVSFTATQADYSIFAGDESVESSGKALVELIDKYWT